MGSRTPSSGKAENGGVTDRVIWAPLGSSEPPAPLLMHRPDIPGRVEEVWLEGRRFPKPQPPLPALPTPGVGPWFLALPLGG